MNNHTEEIWGCNNCKYIFTMPDRVDEDDFSCPVCHSILTTYIEIKEV